MPKRLSRTVVDAVDAAKIIGIKAGARSEHKFTGVWPVVVNGRVYARSWTLKKDGWYHTFLEDRRGLLQVGGREIRVRAVPARSERVRDAVEDAYAAKFTTTASQKYVRGFRTPRRREATMEFVPR
jgi:hypothetical protein